MTQDQDQVGGAEALNNAIAHHLAGRFPEAEQSYRKALVLNPGFAVACSNMAFLCQAQGRLVEAEAFGRRAVELDTGNANGWFNLGATCHRLGRLDDARNCYEQALRINDTSIGVWNNLGFLLDTLGKRDEAETCFRRAVELDPGYTEAWMNLAVLLGAKGDRQGERAAYEKLLAIDPKHVLALDNMASACQVQMDFPGAVSFYERALAVKADDAYAATQLLHCRQYMADWSDLTSLRDRVCTLVAEGKAGAVFPFSMVAGPFSAAEQQACARQFAREKLHPLEPAAPVALASSEARRIRVGYVSADFHDHATAYLVAEVFELHDRERFEIFGYSIGPQDGGPMRQRLARAMEHFTDLAPLDDAAAAGRIRADGLDLLVDLKGYTRGCRLGILARRPAPVLVQFLGYPGTMGSPCIDYLLADDFVIPASHARWYDEKIAWLPDCYQPNDRHREIGASPSRAEAGLPEGVPVFCAFHQSYKILPESFETWMRVLKRVPGSVLWLLVDNPWVRDALHRHASECGVAPERLVFAPKQPLKAHLGRLQLADVFLDTWPVNAHTTASDALWVGLPVVTLPGETFVSRVAGSLLRAVEMPELSASSQAEYEELAYKIATDAEYRAHLKARLLEGRGRVPLFDTPRFTRHLEQALGTMVMRARQGLLPDHFRVAPSGQTEMERAVQVQPLFLDAAKNIGVICSKLGDTRRSRPHSTSSTESLTMQSSSPMFRVPYEACPLCASKDWSVRGVADCSQHPLETGRLERKLTWLRCNTCAHVFTDSYYSPEGLAELFSHGQETQMAGGDWDRQRSIWAEVVDKVVALMPHPEAVLSDCPLWIDVGCGNGGLVATAAEYGFRSVGVDGRQETAARLRAFGYEGVASTLENLTVQVPADVVSMADVLEHQPFPQQSLKKVRSFIREGGVLYLSCPNMDCSSWRAMDSETANPYWAELEHHHNFTRSSLVNLLRQCGFKPVRYGVATRYKAGMEIISTAI